MGCNNPIAQPPDHKDHGSQSSPGEDGLQPRCSASRRQFPIRSQSSPGEDGLQRLVLGTVGACGVASQSSPGEDGLQPAPLGTQCQNPRSSQSSPGEDGLQRHPELHGCKDHGRVSILSGRGWVATVRFNGHPASEEVRLNPLRARMGCNFHRCEGTRLLLRIVSILSGRGWVATT